MPVYYQLDSKGMHKKMGKTHPIIYYEGTIDKSQMIAKGKWFFKRTIIFILGFIPIPYRLGKGTWEMKFEKPN